MISQVRVVYNCQDCMCGFVVFSLKSLITGFSTRFIHIPIQNSSVLNRTELFLVKHGAMPCFTMYVSVMSICFDSSIHARFVD